MTPPTFQPEETLHASRPGIKTLLMIIGIIVLFMVIKFWSELKSVIGIA